MAIAVFNSFRAELNSLRDALTAVPTKTVREDALRERFRTCFRSWASVVHPAVSSMLATKKDFSKLSAEMQALASLTTRIKPVSDYRKRLNRALELVNGLVLYLPSSPRPHVASGGGPLFIPGIPDLSMDLVPNAVLGWKASMEAFLLRYPFDRSLFVMIRYRKRNARLISEIKAIAERHRFSAILASEHSITDDLYNPVACLLCCGRGLAVFDRAEAHQKFNPNVAYELGMMHLLGRECRIFKHASLDVLQTDILMKLYQDYTSLTDITDHMHNWLASGD